MNREEEEEDEEQMNTDQKLENPIRLREEMYVRPSLNGSVSFFSTTQKPLKTLPRRLPNRPHMYLRQPQSTLTHLRDNGIFG